jgi:hypothetical protein
LRDSASQGAITHAVASEQGLITEAGYTEQAKSYANMSKAANMAADAENNAASTSIFSGILKGAAAVASLYTGVPIGAAVEGFSPEAPSDPSNPLRINQYASAEPAPTGGLFSTGSLY